MIRFKDKIGNYKLNASEWFRFMKSELKRKKKSLFFATIFFVVSLYITFWAIGYAGRSGSAVATDLILDNVPRLQLYFFFIVYPVINSLVFFFYAFYYRPGKIDYFLFMIGAFCLTRAFFMSLTHLQVSPDTASYPLAYGLEYKSSSDLFFSGHTGLPFLFYLMAETKFVRGFMLFSSILMGVTVLLSHQHYSIDVFAAFFIVYGVYKIGDRIFGKKE